MATKKTKLIDAKRGLHVRRDDGCSEKEMSKYELQKLLPTLKKLYLYDIAGHSKKFGKE